MDPRIRRRALDAAAKVALSVTSLAGCGGRLEAVDHGGSAGAWTVLDDTPDPASATPARAHGGAPVQDASRSVVTDAARKATLDASVDAAFTDAPFVPMEAGPCSERDLAATAQCCMRHLKDAAADASTEWWTTVPSLPGTPECCGAIYSYCASPGLAPRCFYNSPVSPICCPHFPPNNLPFCGPWGPPTPPVMPRAIGGALA